MSHSQNLFRSSQLMPYALIELLSIHITAARHIDSNAYRVLLFPSTTLETCTSKYMQFLWLRNHCSMKNIHFYLIFFQEASGRFLFSAPALSYLVNRYTGCLRSLSVAFSVVMQTILLLLGQGIFIINQLRAEFYSPGLLANTVGIDFCALTFVM